MARGSDQATSAATSAQNISDQTSANASSLYSTLAPTLMSQAANPSGYNPADLARMDTAAQQSAGGSMAGAVGQGAVQWARTRNAGAADAAIAKSAESAGQTLSQGVLGVRVKNADVKDRQRESALSGMEGLYGTDLGASVNALGEVASNVNANTNAENSSWNWAKYLLDPAMQAAGTAASGYYSNPNH